VLYIRIDETLQQEMEMEMERQRLFLQLLLYLLEKTQMEIETSFVMIQQRRTRSALCAWYAE
jgi:hypothetical protein